MSPTVTAPSKIPPLPPDIDRNKLLTLADLTRWWKCSRKHIWALRKRKGDRKLPCYLLGGNRRAPRFEYEKMVWYLAKHEDA